MESKNQRAVKFSDGSIIYRWEVTFANAHRSFTWAVNENEAWQKAKSRKTRHGKVMAVAPSYEVEE
jgi:hypothetical protein